MSTILQKARGLVTQKPSRLAPEVVRTSYESLPVPIPDSFLAPLPDPSVLKTERIDFANSPLPEYKSCYAVIIDNLLSSSECSQLIHMTEQSAGAHRDDQGAEVTNNGWRPAMVNAGPGHEFLALDYRNSDRIIWDNEVLVKRIWQRVLQGKGIREFLGVLEGEAYAPVFGDWPVERGERWVVTRQGVNERMRFLKYGAGQYFRPHCDGCYENPEGTQRSFFTLHLYLNDSAQALGIKDSPNGGKKSETCNPAGELLRGGATTFHSRDEKRRLDVDPKAGRVLIFQHRRLYHSGDDVVAGIKYTMRSDLMYEMEIPSDGNDDDVPFCKAGESDSSE